MVVAEPRSPQRIEAAEGGAQHRATLQFHRVALAVVEAQGLHPAEALQRIGEAGGGILPAGEEDERALLPMQRGLSHGQSIP